MAFIIVNLIYGFHCHPKYVHFGNYIFEIDFQCNWIGVIRLNCVFVRGGNQIQFQSVATASDFFGVFLSTMSGLD